MDILNEMKQSIKKDRDNYKLKQSKKLSNNVLRFDSFQESTRATWQKQTSNNDINCFSPLKQSSPIKIKFPKPA